ncbi:hypothetical protein [Methylobacillus flagellatus]|uniref:hypothetical protein n=1 Tax=Methylobacillus flagellatus TaxID=405 RepID=UPI000045F34A|nr:hypothetical protein [Methylobacillus flagellatus]
MKAWLKHLSPLICDPATGVLSPAKVWMNIVNLVVSYSFLAETATLGEVSSEKWLIYLAIVGAQSAVGDFISLRYGGRGQGGRHG